MPLRAPARPASARPVVLPRALRHCHRLRRLAPGPAQNLVVGWKVAQFGFPGFRVVRAVALAPRSSPGVRLAASGWPAAPAPAGRRQRCALPPQSHSRPEPLRPVPPWLRTHWPARNQCPVPALPHTGRWPHPAASAPAPVVLVRPVLPGLSIGGLLPRQPFRPSAGEKPGGRPGWRACVRRRWHLRPARPWPVERCRRCRARRVAAIRCGCPERCQIAPPQRLSCARPWPAAARRHRPAPTALAAPRGARLAASPPDPARQAKPCR